MTPTHQEIEVRLRRLLADEGLEPPDRVLHEPRSVGFVWEASKVVVYVDVEDDGPGAVRAGEAAVAA